MKNTSSLDQQQEGKAAQHHAVPKWMVFSNVLCVLTRLLGPRRSVLVVNLSSLGDMLMFRGFLRELRRQRPDERIHLVAKKEGAVLVQDLVDCVIGLDHPHTRLGRMLCGCRIFARKYTRVLHPVYSTVGLAHDICLVADAAEKLAFKGNYAVEGEKSAADPASIYTSLLEADRNLHEMDKLAAFCQFAQISGVSGRDDICPDMVDSRPVREKRPSNRLKIGLCAGARFGKKDWGGATGQDLDDEAGGGMFARLIRDLSSKGDCSFVLLGGTVDRERGDAITRACSGVDIQNLCGRTSLWEAVSVIESCDLCVGNDTFGLHAAIVADTPSVVVMGGGDYPRWVPWKDIEKHRMVTGDCEFRGCGWRCRFDGEDLFKCVRSVRKEAVIAAIDRLGVL